MNTHDYTKSRMRQYRSGIVDVDIDRRKFMWQEVSKTGTGDIYVVLGTYNNNNNNNNIYLRPAGSERLATQWPPEGYGDVLSWGVIYMYGVH